MADNCSYPPISPGRWIRPLPKKKKSLSQSGAWMLPVSALLTGSDYLIDNSDPSLVEWWPHESVHGFANQGSRRSFLSLRQRMSPLCPGWWVTHTHTQCHCWCNFLFFAFFFSPSHLKKDVKAWSFTPDNRGAEEFHGRVSESSGITQNNMTRLRPLFRLWHRGHSSNIWKEVRIEQNRCCQEWQIWRINVQPQFSDMHRPRVIFTRL